jgi:hypothetical protein
MPRDSLYPMFHTKFLISAQCYPLQLQILRQEAWVDSALHYLLGKKTMNIGYTPRIWLKYLKARLSVCSKQLWTTLTGSTAPEPPKSFPTHSLSGVLKCLEIEHLVSWLPASLSHLACLATIAFCNAFPLNKFYYLPYIHMFCLDASTGNTKNLWIS